MIPARCRPWPTGSSPRSTVARQRPSSMGRRSSVGNGDGATCGSQANTRRQAPTPGGPGGQAPGRHRRLPGAHAETRGRSEPVGVPVAVKTFPTEKIRNVALVGHGGSGKTSLAEALLFVAGAIPRLGKVEDGNTVTDFDPEEARRRISVSLALAPFEHDGHKVNVIDTPGYADFVSDVAAALRAADLAVFVVSAVEGVEVQTEIVWRMADELGLPRAIFVNKLDRERASFSRTLDQLKEKFGAGRRAAPAPDRRRSRLPRPRRAARRHRRALRRRQGDHRARSRPRWRWRSTRSTTRSSRASWSATTTSWSATSPTRPSPSTSSRAALADGVASGSRVPGAVRQRDQARRHRPARALHRRGRPPPADRRATARRSRSCSRRSSTPTSGA